jgi:hypothetical protein
MTEPTHTGTWVLPKETYTARLNGACVCGAVKWSYDAAPTQMFHCHCTMCRKHHGTLFATDVAGPLATFRWREGTEKISTWSPAGSGPRGFCSDCGSKVPNVDLTAQRVYMPAGALEGELGIRPQMHLFVRSRAPGYVIADGLPQHATFPPEWGGQALPTPPCETRPGVVSGSCSCGDVRFEMNGRPFRMHHCHCKRCQHARGGAHATNVIYDIEALEFTNGEELVVGFKLPEAQFFGTAFCRNCGGALPRRSPERGAAVVPFGALDSDPEIHPLAHQFVASKASWYDIHDGVPQFAGAPPPPPTR